MAIGPEKLDFFVRVELCGAQGGPLERTRQLAEPRSPQESSRLVPRRDGPQKLRSPPESKLRPNARAQATDQAAVYLAFESHGFLRQQPGQEDILASEGELAITSEEDGLAQEAESSRRPGESAEPTEVHWTQPTEAGAL